MLDPIDLAINKLLALANRREPRDLVDAIYADEQILSFPALVWPVVEKSSGLNPSSHLEQIRRRALTQEDAVRLRFSGAYDVAEAARRYRTMVDDTDRLITENTHREPGCLYFDRRSGEVFLPQTAEGWLHAREHRGALGGVIAVPSDLRAQQTQSPAPTLRFRAQIESPASPSQITPLPGFPSALLPMRRSASSGRRSGRVSTCGKPAARHIPVSAAASGDHQFEASPINSSPGNNSTSAREPVPVISIASVSMTQSPPGAFGSKARRIAVNGSSR